MPVGPLIFLRYSRTISVTCKTDAATAQRVGGTGQRLCSFTTRLIAIRRNDQLARLVAVNRVPKAAIPETQMPHLFQRLDPIFGYSTVGSGRQAMK